MRILIVSDAWFPQVNGVVRTLDRVRTELLELGHEVEMISPDLFKTYPCPTYPEIRLAVLPKRGIKAIIQRFAPCAIHIATEGPLGLAARSVCRKNNWPFTTSYHTRFPEYVSARIPVPTSWGYAFMRWFHGASSGVMVATPSLQRELEGRGFKNIRAWTRGVDLKLFQPYEGSLMDFPRPIHLYVGRVAVEKNIGAFLDMNIDEGTKVVVGDGPQLAELKRKYPDVEFLGAKHGEDLARHYASADVFVFPSLTDTFGLVLLEALATGVPVAAYPVTGPLDVIGDSGVGVLDEDLASAARRALGTPKNVCRTHAETYSWTECAKLFAGYLAPFQIGFEPTGDPADKPVKSQAA